jgi:hypothetical protein
LDTVPGDVVIAFGLKRQPICVMSTRRLTKAHVGRLDIVLSHPRESAGSEAFCDSGM